MAVGKSRTIAVSITRHVKLEVKSCRQCGKTFERTRRAVYCGKQCANKASYERHIERARARRRARYRAAKKKG